MEPSNGRGWAIRFRAYGKRRFVTLGNEGWDRQRAEAELRHVLADVERGIWQSHEPVVVEGPTEVPTFHEFASEWLTARESELRPATVADYRWRLTHHLLPFFASHSLGAITVEEVDRYRTLKVRQGAIGHESINKTLVLLGAILELAIEYGLLNRNPAKGKRRRLRVNRPSAVYLDTATRQETSTRGLRPELTDAGHWSRRSCSPASVSPSSAPCVGVTLTSQAGV